MIIFTFFYPWCLDAVSNCILHSLSHTIDISTHDNVWFPWPIGFWYLSCIQKNLCSILGRDHFFRHCFLCCHLWLQSVLMYRYSHQSYLYFNDFLPSTLKLPTITATMGIHGVRNRAELPLIGMKKKKVPVAYWKASGLLTREPDWVRFPGRNFPTLFL